MNIRTFLFDDDRGVSPVIGVILMVAITVILAAVIAAFVLGLGDTNTSAPNVNFEYDYDGTDTVEVTMTGGESFDPARVSVVGDVAGTESTGTPDYTSSSGEDLVSAGPFSSDETVSAGDSFTVGLDTDTSSTNNPQDDFEIDLIFTSEDGGTSSTIGETSGPDA